MQARQQQHPLYATDRKIADRLLAASTPAQADLVDLARLLNRYEGFRGAPDIHQDLAHCLRSWNLTRGELNAATRVIWQQGFRPTTQEDAEVGSGADVNAA
jgi:hypothetical protein